jgi:hypothetical protein
MEAIIGRIMGYFVLPFAVLTGCWFLLSRIFGDTETVKGIAIIVGGVVLCSWDVSYRRRRSNHAWQFLFVTDEFVPTLHYIPMWIVGTLVCACGASLVVGQ